MFDIVVASTPRNPFSDRVSNALRHARLRVIACDIPAGGRPPTAFKVDAAVACAETAPALTALTGGIRATLEGPPPVVGVVRSGAAPMRGTVDVLPSDAPDSLVVARVQRAAALGERRRGRVVLSGTLADVGLDELLASLSSRRRTCVLRVAAEERRAELALEEGRVVHARADGVAGDRVEALTAAVSAWPDATFEVHSAMPEPGQRPSDERPTVRPPLVGDASDVALAAAVMNAVAGYARTFLPPELVARHLAESRTAASRLDAGIEAFAVSRDGIVSVQRVSAARSALPSALASWCAAFFDACATAMPLRFQRHRMGEVLGGLTRLITQVGWGAALLPREATP